MESQKIWTDILSEIKSQVSLSVFKTWFLGSRALDIKESREKKLLVVGVKNNFLKEHLEQRYFGVISDIAKKKIGINSEIIFVVASGVQAASGREPIFSGVVQNVILKRKVEILNPNYTFENFAVGASNNLPYVAAKGVAGNIGSNYNPLFIYGPTGVGKTHLLQAIGNEFCSSSIDGKTLYVSSEKFTNDYLESLVNKTQIAFRTKYRTLDLLLIDDIQFLSGKESTQDEFFHTFNELVISGKQVVIVADRHPKDLPRIKERLVSRFLGGLSVDVNLPDLEMRTAILRLKCREKGVTIDDDVITYIAESCDGGARELEGSLISALSLSRLSGGKSSLSEIKEATERNKKVINIKVGADKIIDIVSSYYQVKKYDLCGSSRKSKINLARQVAMYFLRQVGGFSLAEIGERVGGRDHSTIIHGVEKIQRLAASAAFGDDLLRIKKLLHKI